MDNSVHKLDGPMSFFNLMIPWQTSELSLLTLNHPALGVYKPLFLLTHKTLGG